MNLREEIKSLLKECTDGQQNLFIRMYSKGNIKKPIDQVVDGMPEDKLAHALFQCENSVKKNKQANIETSRKVNIPDSIEKIANLLKETIGDDIEIKNQKIVKKIEPYKLKTKLKFD